MPLCGRGCSVCTRVAGSGREHRERLPAADRRRRRELRGGPIDLPCGEPREDFLECNPAFQAAQRGAEAEVDSTAKGEVLIDLPVDVEPVTVGVTAVVTVGGTEKEQHDAALRHGPTV